MRIPKNIIVESKYTSGKEYMIISTYKEYQGYYYELNNKIFAGKEFSLTAPELQKIEPSKINPLLTKSSTYVYGIVSDIQLLNTPRIPVIPNSISNLTVLINEKETYYTRKINEVPYSIKQIDKDTFISLQNNSLYQTITLKADYSNLDQAEQQMPGIKVFLGIR